jgi:hypothetical protein
MCLPSGDKLIEAANQACVLWEKDWRGADQSDGFAEKTAEVERAGDETFDGVHGEGALGVADQRGAQDVRKPEFPRFAGVVSGSRVRQPELF